MDTESAGLPERVADGLADSRVDVTPPLRDVAVDALRSIGDAVICTDLAGVVTWINPSAERLLGWSLREIVGVALAHAMVLRDERSGALMDDVSVRVLGAGRPVDLPDGVVLVKRDGTQVPIGDSAAPLRDAKGRTTGVIIVIRDESAQRRIGKRLAFEASHDTLTGLPNRRAFERQLARLREPNTGAPHALLLLDLDRFKAVNDRGGHDAGDALLCAIGPACMAVLRPGDLFARLGGDEFGVLLPRCSLPVAGAIAQALRSAVATLAFSWNGRSHAIGVSIGISVLEGPGDLAADAVRAADRACYAAKMAGRGRTRAARGRRAPAREAPMLSLERP